MLSGSEGQLWTGCGRQAWSCHQTSGCTEWVNVPLERAPVDFSLGQGLENVLPRIFPTLRPCCCIAKCFAGRGRRLKPFSALMLELSGPMHCFVCDTQKLILSLNICKSATFAIAKAILCNQLLHHSLSPRWDLVYVWGQYQWGQGTGERPWGCITAGQTPLRCPKLTLIRSKCRWIRWSSNHHIPVQIEATASVTSGAENLSLGWNI